jgi:hypothetical protein
LADIKDLPLPLDPTTGQPFAYQRAGDKATLSAAPLLPGVAVTGIRYELTVRR